MKKTARRFERLSNDCTDPLTEVHVALPVFTNYYKFLQWSDLLPRKVLPIAKKLARKIAGRFILCDKLQSDITINLIKNEDNHVSLKDVFLGLMTNSKFC